jgi:ABC-type nickel/cobalt efflux system permease component RcnA
VPERLYPWLSVASGALIVTMGLALFVGRLRAIGVHRSGARWLAARLHLARNPLALAASESGAIVLARSSPAAHDHADEQPTHDHSRGATSHRHGFGRPHTHVIPGQDGEPVTWRRLVGLGIFGGLLPCPSAIVVMLSAVALHRVGFGLLLIVFFSLGLAGVLTGIGFVLVYSQSIMRRVPLARRVVERASGSRGATAIAIRAFPVLSAAAVVVAGLIVTSGGLRQF